MLIFLERTGGREQVLLEVGRIEHWNLSGGLRCAARHHYGDDGHRNPRMVAGCHRPLPFDLPATTRKGESRSAIGGPPGRPGSGGNVGAGSRPRRCLRRRRPGVQGGGGRRRRILCRSDWGRLLGNGRRVLVVLPARDQLRGPAQTLGLQEPDREAGLVPRRKTRSMRV